MKIIGNKSGFFCISYLVKTMFYVHRMYSLLFLLLLSRMAISIPVNTNTELFTHILNNSKRIYEPSPIIEKNEWRELKLYDLLKKLDYTKTSFGMCGLQLLSCPIDDIDEIQARQNIIRQLVHEDQLKFRIRALLKKIKKYEKSVLSYWNEGDGLNKSVQDFYISLPVVKQYANNNRLLLEGSMFVEWSRSLLNFAKALCLGGLLQEVAYLIYGGSNNFDLVRGLIRGFQEPLMNNNPRRLLTKKDYNHTYGEYINIFINGTLGDRCHAFSQGYDRNIAINIPFLKKRNIITRSVPKNALLPVKLIAHVAGISLALGYTTWYDIRLGRQIRDVFKQIVFLHTVANMLHRRLIGVSRFIRTTEKLYETIKRDPVLRDSRVARTMRTILKSKKISKTLKQVFNLLHQSTFDAPSKMFYSRGRVLLAHKKLHEVKNELIPLLQALAELDAYYSIATVYKKQASKKNTFSFVEFVDTQKPYINFEQCWIPLLSDDQIVTNDVHFGDDEHPSKLIITGPNGCGKSTYLKTVGQAAILAQSWGIVPAQNARMTLLHGVRTCLASYENLSTGLSTFMAEDKRMLQLQEFIDQNSAKNTLLLIDEPWRGTVDVASAQYIYAFGKYIAPLQNCITCIATHVKKPIDLAQETDGLFSNAQVAIDQKDDLFTRTFKLKSGPALWWFQDDERRSRFITWLKTIY